MAARKIIWSHKARIKLHEILDYYIKRNQNKTYSTKLFVRFNRELRLLIKHPELGVKTEIEGVRALIVEDYLFFYKAEDHRIIIYTLWDCRQDEKNLNII